MTETAFTDALREVPLFRQLSEAELSSLSAQIVRRTFERNELIFTQGDQGDGLYIVESGHVSIIRQNLDGDELILAISEPGEFFGELALFDAGVRAAGAVALDGCTMLFLSRDAFRSFIESHPAALYACTLVIVRQLRRLTDLADEIALMDVRSRLARRILRLADAGMVSTNGADVTLHITQQQVASMLGATRESVNKHLKAFAAAGAVKLERGGITVLDREWLEECAAGPA